MLCSRLPALPKLHIIPPFLIPVIKGRSIWFLLSFFPFPREVPPLAVVLYHIITTVTKCFLLPRASRSFGQRSRFCFMRVFRLIFFDVSLFVCGTCFACIHALHDFLQVDSLLIISRSTHTSYTSIHSFLSHFVLLYTPRSFSCFPHYLLPASLDTGPSRCPPPPYTTCKGLSHLYIPTCFLPVTILIDSQFFLSFLHP